MSSRNLILLILGWAAVLALATWTEAGQFLGLAFAGLTVLAVALLAMARVAPDWAAPLGSVLGIAYVSLVLFLLARAAMLVRGAAFYEARGLLGWAVSLVCVVAMVLLSSSYLNAHWRL
jgi:hypothetical protein